MAELPPLSEVIRAHGLSAKKSLGQHFLLDPNLLAKIVRAAALPPGAPVYEVGPGPGGLTRALLAAGHAVTAVERDDRAVAALTGLSAAYPGRLNVLAEDALAIDEAASLPRHVHIVANLPYNIGSALLVRWLTADRWPPWWAGAALMFQKEVAERIVARPDTDAYGRLSVLAQWRAEPRIALELPSRAFTPPPKVSSAIVRIVPAAQPAGVALPALEAVTQAAFAQRRKMLRASLKALAGCTEALERVGIAGERRAETLSVAEFVALAAAWDRIRAGRARHTVA
ncbi:MAG: 16S rRNA (adenine(1518)-N(6)/adenine(1519)-N(6))-dimethyltransferase RsmA [Sphingomonadaceae bacterium]|nr:16S rRNA (adenine(1518)-N(6)/adenine(1519)-N(6))-dimethyltransferase RsmA [Sphingomonadaceae bacterium]